MRKWVALAAVAAAAFAAGMAARAQIPTSRATARGAARQVLETLRLPPRAARAQSDPSGARLSRPAMSPRTPNLIDLHQFWTVPRAPRTVLDWLEAHPPAGTKEIEGGETGIDGSVVSGFVGFTLMRPRFGSAPSETLLLTVARARGGGTAIRVDAQVVWLVRRPASERIPAGTRAITVTERRSTGRRSGPWTVTDRRRVRRIVSMVDRLPAAQPGPVACPADVGPIVTLGFASAASGGHRLARVVADGGGCGFVALWIRGHRRPALQGGAGLIKFLGPLLGIRLR